MNCYDFDKTLLRGNTVQRFWWYCLPRFPYLILLFPLAMIAGIFWALHLLPKEIVLRMLEFYEIFVPNKPKLAKKFWDKNEKHLKKWYLNQKRDDDVVVSASPDYLIGEICGRLGVRFIATKTHKNGMAKGKHCFGKEKVEEFRKAFPDVVPQSYYSDSMSDSPMFSFAKEGYLVKGETVTLVYRDGVKISE